MKISIITPAFNSESYIRETIDSIHQQTYKNFEHIVVDGLSKDNTVRIVKEYKNITCISERDKGQSDAINKGLKIATGDILAWQNADDLYFPDTFQTVIDYFRNNPQADVVYGNYQLIDSTSHWICDVYPMNWNTWMFAHGRFCPLQPTVFWRRKVTDQTGLLDEQLHYCMDVDLFSRCVNNGFAFHRIAKMLGRFRVHNSSKTQNKENEKKVLKEYKEVLTKNFNYSAFDTMFFNFFQWRANLAKNIKQNYLRKL